MTYTAVVLEKTSIQLLTWAMRAAAPKLEKKGFQMRAPEKYRLPHHMTINLGSFDLSLNHENVLTSEFAQLSVDALFWSEQTGVAAFRVSSAEAWTEMQYKPIETINDKKSHAHITVALANGVRPVHSNHLFSDEPPEDLKVFEFNDPLILRGSVTEVG